MRVSHPQRGRADCRDRCGPPGSIPGSAEQATLGLVGRLPISLKHMSDMCPRFFLIGRSA
ncbi:hypothetical protein BLAT2472_70106 [Burkholderia latens]